MITPNDIETKVFSSSVRGYNKREVDEFLDQIMIDYQALLDQNAKMLERVHVLQKQVSEAKDPSHMSKDAQRLMSDISASAEQKAEVIIQNAKNDAANIVKNAKNSTAQTDEDAERLRQKVENSSRCLRTRWSVSTTHQKISSTISEGCVGTFGLFSFFGQAPVVATVMIRLFFKVSILPPLRLGMYCYTW